MRIVLVRHAQSAANAAGIWQGQAESGLSETGYEQVRLLGKRLAGADFELVVSSDLERARETAAAVGAPVEVDPVWRELDLGGWEGRTFEEVAAAHPDLLGAIRRGEAIAFGGTGETIGEFEERVVSAFDALAARVGEGDVVVVTHGGVIDSIAGRSLGRNQDRRTFPVVTNTSLTVFEGRPGHLRLASFNDATHLGWEAGYLRRQRRAGLPAVALVRHGITAANRDGRIQGQSCWGLDPEGREQARRLAEWYGAVERVISSPLQRAQETAEALAGEAAVEIEPALAEMGFGEWEGEVYLDLLERDVLARRIWAGGEDLPRGHTGESFADVVARVGGFLAGFIADPAQRTVMVSHGAAIRALVAGLSGRGFDIAETLHTPPNASFSHLVLTPEGPVLADYGLAPHLEGGL